jgi:hypothetical protein
MHFFKKAIFTSVLMLWLPLLIFAQVKPIFQINYDRIENGIKSEAGVSILYHDQLVYLYKATDKIQQYIDYKRNEIVNIMQFGNASYKNVLPFSELPEPVLGDKNMDILGYPCRYASYVYFSNSIEIWYTTVAQAKGSPFPNFLPEKDALALKIVINGNREVIATSIETLKDFTLPKYTPDKARQLNDAEFEEVKINSRFTRLPVFTDETVNFDPDIEAVSDEVLMAAKTYHFSLGSVILKKVRLSREMCNSGNVFVKFSCRSNGDAYDRTGSVFMIPESEGITVLDAYLNGLGKLPVFTDCSGKNYQGIRKEANYQPPVELMRFFTSFGAGHFNEIRQINNYLWAEEAVYKQEVTALIPWEPQDVWIGVFIGNYDKGGHIVSLELDFYPGSEEESEMVPKFILPLFSTINTLEMSGQNYGRFFNNDTLGVAFELPEDVTDLHLLYTSTGHGGWGGGDEFNPKLNQIFIDGEAIYNTIPWRTDCATYRLLNPASGNFSNGLSSSDLSRSNWCPGTLTPPDIVSLNNLKPGHHVLEVVIDQGKDEGESFNHWGVTGVLTGNIKVLKQ